MYPRTRSESVSTCIDGTLCFQVQFLVRNVGYVTRAVSLSQPYSANYREPRRLPSSHRTAAIPPPAPLPSSKPTSNTMNTQHQTNPESLTSQSPEAYPPTVASAILADVEPRLPARRKRREPGESLVNFESSCCAGECSGRQDAALKGRPGGPLLLRFSLATNQ